VDGFGVRVVASMKQPSLRARAMARGAVRVTAGRPARATRSDKAPDAGRRRKGFLGKCWDGMSSQGSLFARVVLPGLASLCVAWANPADASSTIIRLPGSPNPEVFAVQKTIIQAWQITRDSFVDESSTMGKKWEKALSDTLARTVADGDDVQGAYKELGVMLNEVREEPSAFLQRFAAASPA